MKPNTYQNAVDHLVFSDDMYETVMSKAVKPKRSYRILRAAAIAAVMVCLLATTAFAVSPEFRDWTVSLLKLGVSREEMTDAAMMEFRHEEVTDGVTIHYLELDKSNYTFVHGMLVSPQTGYLRITEDYRLEPVEMKKLSVSLEKNGRVYQKNLDYTETEKGILSQRISVLQRNDRGEIFLNATDGNSHQWPVYVIPETGEVRDALPDWTEDDFEGRVAYAYELWDGILICTVVDEFKVVNGNSAGYNLLYWIENGATEFVLIDLPENEYGWYCENNALYCKNIHGHLFRMNENFEFDLLYDYETGDDLTNGLYTVATENGELAIIDVYSDEIYEIPAYTVNPGRADGYRCRTGPFDIDETMGYNATRYSADGKIALIQTDWLPEQHRVALLKLGILNQNTGELMMLEVENDYGGYGTRWLDENRLASIYNEKYLCIYEFED